MLQDVAWVQEGIDTKTTKAIKIDSVHELKTVQAMRKVLHGESIEVLIAVHRDNLDQAKRAVDHLIQLLPTLGDLNMLIFEKEEAQPPPLITGALDLATRLPMRVEAIRLADRAVTKMLPAPGTHTVWVVHSTAKSHQSECPSCMRMLRLMERGQDPNVILFDVPCDEEIVAIQFHKSWGVELYAHLGVTAKEADECAGPDPAHTQFAYVRLD